MKLFRSLLLSLVVVTLMAGPSMALDIFTEDLSAFNEKIEVDSPGQWENSIVPPVTPFNDGNALRMLDLSAFEKPEVRGETASSILLPFRVDFQSYNQSPQPPAKASAAIRYRMSNAGKSITSESRSAFSLSWQADGKFTAKYSDGGANDGNPNDVDTKSILLNLSQVYDITMVANGQNAGTFSYNYFGVNRTLNPLHYDVYVDGVLLNSGTDAWFANGMKFTLEKSAADYDPTLGLSQFGLVGSSDADVGPDVLFDNIILTVIPEPATFSLLLGALVVLRGLRRRP